MMMYGFGDVQQSSEDTRLFLKTIVEEYMKNTVRLRLGRRRLGSARGTPT